MRYIILIIGFQLCVTLGFSQEKNDTLIKSTPQPVRMEKAKLNSTKSAIKRKTPENKRVTAIDIMRNKTVDNKTKKPENKRIENK